MTLSSTLPLPWFWLIAGAGTGIFVFYRGFLLLQHKRVIENTPVSKIRSAAMGPVEISGLAVGPYTINAPITGRPCYCYRTLVWQWKQQGKNSSWVKVVDESLHVPFYLDDNTGRLLVDPSGAEMEIHRDFQEEFSHSLFSSSLDIPGNIAQFLGVHGLAGDKKIKIEEYCVKPKNSLFVLGTLSENHGLEATPIARVTAPTMQMTGSAGPFSGLLTVAMDGLASALPEAAVASSTITFTGSRNTLPQSVPTPQILQPAKQAQVVAAMMKAGITNPVAWAAAGVNPGQAVTSASAGGGGAAAAMAPEQFDLRPPVVLKKGTRNPLFLISWRSQRDVVKSLGWKSALMIWGGPALTLFCAYLLAAQLGWL